MELAFLSYHELDMLVAKKFTKVLSRYTYRLGGKSYMRIVESIPIQENMETMFGTATKEYILILPPRTIEIKSKKKRRRAGPDEGAQPPLGTALLLDEID